VERAGLPDGGIKRSGADAADLDRIGGRFGVDFAHHHAARFSGVCDRREKEQRREDEPHISPN
jgi:hypothetical protein